MVTLQSLQLVMQLLAKVTAIERFAPVSPPDPQQFLSFSSLCFIIQLPAVFLTWIGLELFVSFDVLRFNSFCLAFSVCLSRMGATVFVQPLDLVKNRMQLSGQGTKAREYKTSFHALFSILKNEGIRGIYTGYLTPPLPLCHIFYASPTTGLLELLFLETSCLKCVQTGFIDDAITVSCILQQVAQCLWCYGPIIQISVGYKSSQMLCFLLCLSLSAGLLRQATYTTTRLGIYTILFEKMTGADGRPPSFILKVHLTVFTILRTTTVNFLLLVTVTACSPCRL